MRTHVLSAVVACLFSVQSVIIFYHADPNPLTFDHGLHPTESNIA